MSKPPDFPVRISVQAEPFDASAETDRLSQIPDAGAVVSFLGLCRSEGGRLAGLELEHYPGMVEAELERLTSEAATRWPLKAVTVIHRHGRVLAGEAIVLVLTVSAHRAAAFAAAEFLMDWLKSHAPFWKRELMADGSTGAWIEAKESDDAAAERWLPRAAE